MVFPSVAEVLSIKEAVIKDDAPRHTAQTEAHKILRKSPKLFGTQAGIAAAFDVEVAFEYAFGIDRVVAVEGCFVMVVRAEVFEGAHHGEYLGIGGGDQGLFGLVGKDVFALGVDHQHTQGGALEFGIAKDLGYLFLEGLEGVVFDGRNGRKEDLERGRWCGMEGQREKKQTAQEAGY